MIPHDASPSRPYPFFLAYALDQPVELLGDRARWQAEWKWDGIRCQLIRRSGQTFLWSRGEELVTERYPEIATVGDILPAGTVIDGEILPWKDERPLPFAQLQKRIGRKNLSRSILAQVPVIVMAYDLLEYQGTDIRTWPLNERRHKLAELIKTIDSPLAPALSRSLMHQAGRSCRARWAVSRDVRAEGLMLKDRDSAYGVGRRRGDWWKWKVLPLHDRCCPDCRPARQRQAGEPVYRLYLRRLGQWFARYHSQGVFRP